MLQALTPLTRVVAAAVVMLDAMEEVATLDAAEEAITEAATPAAIAERVTVQEATGLGRCSGFRLSGVRRLLKQ